MVKADTLEGFLKSTEVLADFPKQVVLAKEVTVSSGLRGKRRGMKKRLTDGKRTRTFRKWCKQRDAIKRGEKNFDLHEANRNAKLHVEDIIKGAEKINNDLTAHADTHYTKEELTIIRKGEKWNDAVTKKVIESIVDFARKFYEAHPDWRKRRVPQA
jgi:vacuolar-type H+-ATPase subunit H